MADCLLALGSNLGQRARQLDAAIDRISKIPQTLVRQTSSYYDTEPIGGPGAQARFLNAVVRVTSELSPTGLFTAAQQLERELGRTGMVRWGPRLIDIDLLTYDALVIETPELTLPHPRMAVRRFVLQPACEVAPELIHAPTGWSLRELLDRLDRTPCYVAVCCADPQRSNQLVIGAAARLNTQPLLCSVDRSAVPFRDEPAAALRSALASLAHQHALLESPRAKKSTELLLSDFWLNESLALAHTWPAGPEQAKLQQACRAAIALAPEPRFVLHLDLDPASRTTPLAAASGDPSAREERPGLLPALRRQLALPGQAPVLHTAADDEQLAFIELQAGIDAMR